MHIRINDRTVTFPSSLAEFTLGQRIDFHSQYGRQLDEMAKSILKMEDGPEKELETMHYSFEKIFRTFGFFAGVDPEVLKESDFVDDIANIYHANLATLFEDEQNIELQQEFVWNGETWQLHAPELKHGSKMKFGEFIDSKQLIKDMIDLGNGKWDYMLPLCVIFLRKKGENYQEEFLYEGSDRLQLMRSLPMNIALAIGFFLTSSVNIYLSTLQSSSLPGQKAAASIALSIMPAGDGSIS